MERANARHLQQRRIKMNTYRKASILYGVLFILSFLSYGIGSGMVDALTNDPQNLANVQANASSMFAGFLLMGLVHTTVTVGSVIVIIPLLKKFNQTLSYLYLGGTIIENVLLSVGAIFAALTLPLSTQFVEAGSASPAYYEMLAGLLYKGNFFAYELGMAIWALAGLAFTYILIQSRLVPRFLSVWGFVGYITFFTGIIIELLGSPFGTWLYIPGAVFEITISFWLIFKGFEKDALEELPA
jgi:hypothetical protein